MFNCIVYSEPASEPVTTAELKAHLRLNTTDEDTLLSLFITTARQQFEHSTQRPVITQTIRQYCSYLPGYQYCSQYQQPFPGLFYRYPPIFAGIIYLMKGNVQSVSQVKYYDVNDALQTDTTYTTDLTTDPARITWQTRPILSLLKANPIYVDYVCGFTSVPSDVKVSICLLAAHYFERREAHITESLHELPDGFERIVAKYKTGVSGDWGM
jgi:hypothetical protein